MKIATTTGDFTRFVKTDTECLTELHRAGFRYVDLSMYNMNSDSVYMKEGWESAIRLLAEHAAELGMTFVQAHSPGGNPLSENEDSVDRLTKCTLRSIEICSILGIKNTVVHFGTRKGIDKSEWFRLNKEFYEKLLPTAERLGVNVLCENSCKVNVGELYHANRGSELREFAKYVNHPNFHVCWDVGHGNCDGNQYYDLLDLGEELYAIHYNDNRGTADEHLPAFMGTVGHDEVMSALIKIGFKGYFTLESGAALRPYKYWLGDRREPEAEGIVPRLTDPHIFMQRHIEKFMYETAKWMLESYGIYEE